MNNYYYLCSYPLEPGSVVLPGNWGRLLKNSNCSNIALNLAKEQTFENVRLKSYPSLPSRFEAIFLCESLDGARQFRQGSNRLWSDIIYEVELLEPEKPSFRTDWTLVNVTPQDTVAQVEERARQYWSGSSVNNPELLSLSKIRIINRVPN